MPLVVGPVEGSRQRMCSSQLVVVWSSCRRNKGVMDGFARGPASEPDQGLETCPAAGQGRCQMFQSRRFDESEILCPILLRRAPVL